MRPTQANLSIEQQPVAVFVAWHIGQWHPRNTASTTVQQCSREYTWTRLGNRTTLVPKFLNLWPSHSLPDKCDRFVSVVPEFASFYRQCPAAWEEYSAPVSRLKSSTAGCHSGMGGAGPDVLARCLRSTRQAPWRRNVAPSVVPGQISCLSNSGPSFLPSLLWLRRSHD